MPVFVKPTRTLLYLSLRSIDRGYPVCKNILHKEQLTDQQNAVVLAVLLAVLKCQ